MGAKRLLGSAALVYLLTVFSVTIARSKRPLRADSGAQ